MLPQSYFKVKEQYPKALVICQKNDICTMYNNDAIVLSCLFDVDLTNIDSRNLCASFASYKLDIVLPKLVRNNYRIAICED